MERRLDKSIKYVMVSGKKALADAGLAWDGSEIKVTTPSSTGSGAHMKLASADILYAYMSQLEMPCRRLTNGALAPQLLYYSTCDSINACRITLLSLIRTNCCCSWLCAQLFTGNCVNILMQDLNKARCGILIGSAFGGMQTFATAVEALELQSE